MSVPEYFELPGGDRMPRVGFGTWQASNEVLEDAVTAALEAGYRHFDSARAYENEPALGRALRRWIGDNPSRRKELFVVTKLPPSGNRPELVQEYFEGSLKDLGLEYIDLYLIHTPFAFEHVPGDLHPKNPDGSMKVDYSTDLLEVWKTMLKLKESGRVRHIGVSNMNDEQISRLCAIAKPASLQIEVHALCQQKKMLAAAKKLDIPVVAYSPLGSRALADTLSANNGYVSMLRKKDLKVGGGDGLPSDDRNLLCQRLTLGCVPKHLIFARHSVNFNLIYSFLVPKHNVNISRWVLGQCT